MREWHLCEPCDGMVITVDGLSVQLDDKKGRESRCVTALTADETYQIERDIREELYAKYSTR